MAFIQLPLMDLFSDYPDSESNAVTVFFRGCEHHCRGCQNPELQVADGEEWTVGVNDIYPFISSLIAKARLCLTNKIVFSGGDPLHPVNREFVKVIVPLLKQRGFHIAIYTGYDIKTVKTMGVKCFDFVKCGKYVEEGKRLSGKRDGKLYLASANQEIYNHKFKKVSKKGIMKFRKKRFL